MRRVYIKLNNDLWLLINQMYGEFGYGLAKTVKRAGKYSEKAGVRGVFF